MAKTASRARLRPQLFGLGNGVYRSDVLAVVEGQNYAVAEHVQRVHFSGEERPVVHDSTSGVVLLRGFVYVPPWASSIAVRAESAGLKVDVGSGSVTLSSGTQSGTIATSASGTGLLTWTAETTGSAGQLDELAMEAGPTAATSLPDPAVE